MNALDFTEKATILVVDDAPANLLLMAKLLKDYKVQVVNGGEKALSIAASDSPPDLILLDRVLDVVKHTQEALSV